MDQPSNLRTQLREAFERADAEIKSQGEAAVKLKEQLREVVEAVESEDEPKAKELMEQALTYEFNWLGDCAIGSPLQEFLGYDEEE